MTRPEADEAAPYYSRYIDLVASDDIVTSLTTQLDETVEFLRTVSEEQSLKSYEPGKWTIREVLNHLNDSERIFACRALWFARGFEDPLPGYDQDLCVQRAQANEIPWSQLVEEFRNIRSATVALFKNLPQSAWSRTGVANDSRFTVHALAYIIAGHVIHHTSVIKGKYL